MTLISKAAAHAHAREVFDGQPNSTLLDKARRAVVQAFMYGVRWDRERSDHVAGIREQRVKQRVKLLLKEIENLKMERRMRI